MTAKIAKLGILWLATLSLNARAQLTATDAANAYQQYFQSEVKPFYEQSGKSSQFKGEKGLTIRYRTFINPQAIGSITVSPGQGEPFQKYAEVAYDLYRQGYSVFMIDHRGQGTSDRSLPDATKQYVDSFDNYVYDLKTFFNTVVMNSPGPRFLLAHSMGGCIAAFYAELYPEDFKAIVLSSPMLKIKLLHPDTGKPVAEPLALALLAKREYWDRTGTDFAGKAKDPAFDVFGADSLTHDLGRWQMYHDLRLANKNLRLFGTTNHWVRESVSTSIFVRTRDMALQARVPILLFQAGEDSLILPEGQAEFCQNAPACKLQLVPGAGHEILMETDAIRAPVMNQTLDFFKAHAQ